MKDQIDEAAIAHYRDELIGAASALGHPPARHDPSLLEPVWVADPRDNLLRERPERHEPVRARHRRAAPRSSSRWREHAALLAQRFGDLVDEWGTRQRAGELPVRRVRRRHLPARPDTR